MLENDLLMPQKEVYWTKIVRRGEFGGHTSKYALRYIAGIAGNMHKVSWKEIFQILINTDKANVMQERGMFGKQKMNDKTGYEGRTPMRYIY